MTPHTFLDALMQLAGRFKFRETSGYRSAGGNQIVGGVKYSSHQFWLGRDILLDPGEDTVMFTEAARRVGLKVLNEGDHLHVQPATWEKG